MSAMIDLVGTETILKYISQSVEKLWPKNRFSPQMMGKTEKFKNGVHLPIRCSK